VNDPTPDPLEQRSRELFEDSVGRLDARTRSRLNQARQQALNELNKRATRRYWLVAPLGGLVAAAVVAVVMMTGRGTNAPGQDSAALPLDDFDIVADADSLELLQDVEFYSWMAEASGNDANSSG
jgi:NAD(P)H-hydrate repair Nnr-like enzyme with NAD(P)H-hydrate dehydratase domain